MRRFTIETLKYRIFQQRVTEIDSLGTMQYFNNKTRAVNLIRIHTHIHRIRFVIS